MASLVAVPLTFAPAGEPVSTRENAKPSPRPWRRQRTGSGVPPRKRQVGQKRIRALQAEAGIRARGRIAWPTVRRFPDGLRPVPV